MKKILIICILVLFLVLIGGSVVSAQTKFSLGITSPLIVGVIWSDPTFGINPAPVILSFIDFSAYEMVTKNIGIGLRYFSFWGVIGALMPSAELYFENKKLSISTEISGGLVYIAPSYLLFGIITGFPGIIIDQGFYIMANEHYQFGISMMLGVLFGELFYEMAFPTMISFSMRYMF